MRLKHKSGKLILGLVAILAFAFAQSATCAGEKSASGTVSTINPAEENDRQVVVYYFHGKYRCYTCKRIEKLTREAVEGFFYNEMKAGLVVMKAVNVDEPENKHFTADYHLFTRSVIVSDMQNGKEKQWKNLQKVWELFQDDDAFQEYIRDEVKAYM